MARMTQAGEWIMVRRSTAGPNHYGRGRRFELDVAADLECYGYGVMLAPGSHGSMKIDILAQHPDGTQLWIQCKSNDIHKIAASEWNTLRRWAGFAGGVPVLASKDPRHGHRSEIIYEEITGDRVLYSRAPHPKVLYSVRTREMIST
jgi:Holliday junction resolvase